MNRRQLVAGIGAIAGIAGIGGWILGRRNEKASSIPQSSISTSNDLNREIAMRYRRFGSTDLMVSEVGFGAWGIGGTGYGAVEKAESLRTLARAEELGCNFVDTALVYGDSERLLGEFLQGRRDRWIVATKYSGQSDGMTATLEKQLSLLRSDVVDFYQIHWAPIGEEEYLYDELQRLKDAGKVRYIGVSLSTASEIDFILSRSEIDGFQVAFNLLQPDPFLSCVEKIRKSNKGLIIRSAFREGFLTGKYDRDVTFPDPNDQRHSWTREEIERTVDLVEQFRFIEDDAGSMAIGAARYPLSFPEVATVILGTKSVSQADSNFGEAPGAVLSQQTLNRISVLQTELGLRDPWWRRLLRTAGFAA